MARPGLRPPTALRLAALKLCLLPLALRLDLRGDAGGQHDVDLQLLQQLRQARSRERKDVAAGHART